jgi:predicted trehalose synthase
MKIKLKAWKKTIIPAVLAVALAIPLAAYAADDSNPSPDPSAAPTQQEQIKKVDTANIHQQQYMQLLLEKYAPNQLNDWKLAVAERERLLAEAKAKVNQKVKDSAKDKVDKKIKEKASDRRIENKMTADRVKAKKKMEAMKKASKHPGFAGKKDLAIALQSGDTEAIRAALTKQLAAIQKANTLLSDRLAKAE